jgi:GH25 family lysozyme M1 (1,4-beta-N-acetylmuramidase)
MRTPRSFVRTRPPSPAAATKSETFKNLALGVAGVISSVVIPLLGFTYASKDKEREVSKDFVEIATKILSESPSPENKPLREWAIDLINSYSTVKLSDDARNALLNKQPIFQPTAVGLSITKNVLVQVANAGHLLGISIYHGSPKPDFQALKRRGIQFVFIKATQGVSPVDPTAKERAEEARANGIKVGLYHFFDYGDVQAQFQNFDKALKDIPFDLPPVVDCEYAPGGDQLPADYAARVADFASKLEQSHKRKIIIYAGAPFADAHLGPQEANQYLFIADFRASSRSASKPVLPKWWTDYQFWDLAESVSDDDLLRGYEVVGFKGNIEQLNAL